MKTLFLLSAFTIFSILAFGQPIKHIDKQSLQKKEDSLKIYAVKLLEDSLPEGRYYADSLFTKIFVRAIKINNSFYYPFDSLESISRLYAPDSSFRIFTWQIVIGENIVHQHGAIQMKTRDGSLKLYPLFDKSDVILNQSDTISNNKGWMGAVYYKIIQTKNNDHNFYTLLGFDENNMFSNKKIIEVLSFNNDEPVFGGSYFSFAEDSVPRSPVNRYIIEYKDGAGAKLNFDNDLNMIIVDHLVSVSNEPKKKWTYVPDGDYEGF